MVSLLSTYKMSTNKQMISRTQVLCKSLRYYGTFHCRCKLHNFVFPSYLLFRFVCWNPRCPSIPNKMHLLATQLLLREFSLTRFWDLSLNYAASCLVWHKSQCPIMNSQSDWLFGVNKRRLFIWTEKSVN